MEKTKKSNLWRYLAVGACGLAIGGSLLYAYSPNFKNKLNNLFTNNEIVINQDLDNNNTNSGENFLSSDYFSLINKYSKDIDNLQVQISLLRDEANRIIAEKQAEIEVLQEELQNTQETDSEIIAEKNQRIAALRAYIEAMQSENAEELEEYKQEIDYLNERLLGVQTQVLQSIKLPSDVVFNGFNFKLLNENIFVVYSANSSGNLYCFNKEQNKLYTIQDNSYVFDSFYFENNLLFYRAGSNLKYFNFSSKEVNQICNLACPVVVTSKNENIYFITAQREYIKFNVNTHSIISNNIETNSNSDLRSYLYENYFLFIDRNNSSSKLTYFSLETEEFSEFQITAGSANANQVNFSFYNTQFGCMFSSPSGGLYILNFNDNSLNRLGSSIYFSVTELNEKVFVCGAGGLYVYDGTNFTSVSSLCKGNHVLKFYPKNENVYYFVASSPGTNTQDRLYGLFQYNYLTNVVTQVDSTSSYFDYVIEDGDNVYIFLLNGSCYVLDSIAENYLHLSGTVYNYEDYLFVRAGTYFKCYFKDTKELTTSNSISALNTGAYAKFINGRFYFTNNNTLYVIDPKISVTTYVRALAFDSKLSHPEVGVYYENLGSVDGGNVFCKYVLTENGLEQKELILDIK